MILLRTHLVEEQVQEADWCNLWDSHVERFWASLVHTQALSPTQRLQLHLPLASELWLW